MGSYVSADFEIDYLEPTDEVRLILRNRDTGDVPPAPSAVHFPTYPDSLKHCIVAEYVSDSIGERYVRVATPDDIGALPYLALNTLVDTTTDFSTVLQGDKIVVSPTNYTLWQSTEYPSTTFEFTVANVVDSTTLEIYGAFPAFMKDISWELTGGSLRSNYGVTRRAGNPTGPVYFKDRRFTTYHASVASAHILIASVKAGLDALATDTTTASLSDTTYTAKSKI